MKIWILLLYIKPISFNTKKNSIDEIKHSAGTNIT